MSHSHNGRPIIEIWEPTYRMKPAEEERFRTQRVEDIVKEILTSKLEGVTWQADTASKLNIDISNEIKSRIKGLEFPRYKLVVQTVIGEVQGQGAYITSRCLWDTESDNYASFAFKNSSVFCTAMVFGVYME